MTIELKMPALSPTMDKGTLAKWLIGVGDVVKAGDLVAEIETDKATMELEADTDGRLDAILIPAGSEDVAVGTVLAVLNDDAEPVMSVDEPREESQSTAAEPAAVSLAVSTSVTGSSVTEIPRARLADKVKVSPLAARIASALGISLDDINGTGPQGRIVRADFGVKPKAPISSIPAASVAAQIEPVSFPPPAGVTYDVVKLTGMRKTIARRLTLAKQTIPHFYLSLDCRIDALLRFRAELNSALAPEGLKLSVNDFLVKALALALTDVPEANVQFAGDELFQFDRVDVSVAVALDGGLITPVIRHACAKSLSAIGRETRALAAQAREGALAPEQYQGGTVSVSNLGMYGIERIFPVINPPQAMILGVGAGQEKIIPVDGLPTIGTIMTLTASFDHRAIDGAAGARALASVRQMIETPLLLVG